MREPKRALTLKVDANSTEDMVMLLQQALYEIEQFLPANPNGTGVGSLAEHRNRAKTRAFTLSKSNSDLVSTGFTEGSIGSYRFEFIHSSRRHYELEEQLLAAGYTRNVYEGFLSEEIEYTHPSLPTKCIAGEPLQVQDKK